MNEKVNPEALIVGRRYQVTFEDCCIAGEATGVFLGTLSDDIEDGNLTLLFNWGELTRCWQCTFAEVDVP